MKQLTETQLKSYEYRAEILFKELHLKDGETFPEDSTILEKCVLHLRRCYCSYGVIQSRLGMIPKNLIRETLLKYEPELVDIDTNRHKIPDKLHKDYDWNWEEFKKG